MINILTYPKRIFAALLSLKRPVKYGMLVCFIILSVVVGWQLFGQKSQYKGPTLRIGYQKSPPYQIVLPDGRIRGVAIDIVREAARRRNIPLEWVYSPESPDVHIQSGDVDMWPIVTDLPHRHGYMHITKPIYENSIGVMYLEGMQVNEPEDLNGKRVAYYDREPGISLMSKLLPGAQGIPVPGHVDALGSVLSERCDAALIWSTKDNSLLFKRAIDANPRKSFRFYYFPDEKINCGVAAAKDNPDAVLAADMIREEIEALVTSGYVQEVYFRYYLDPENEISTYFFLEIRDRRTRWLITIMAVLVVLFLALGFLALKLKKSRQVAFAASRAKSEFLANVSHELRTPLNGIMGMTEVALTEPDLNEKTRLMRVVMESGETLLTLVNDILDLSKIEAGKMELEHLPVDLNELLDSTLPFFVHMGKEKRIEVAVEKAESCPNAFVGDPVRLRQVLFNLMGNAVKFTQQGKVTLSIHCVDSDAGQLLLFEVRDTGIGIPQDRLQAIFESFSQVDSSSTRIYGGTGLGLSITRNLLHLMKGSIEVESRLGQGSVFRCFIPYIAADGVLPQNDSKDALFDFPIGEGLRILVVDDNEMNRRVARTMLKRMGHSVSEAHDGVQALRKLKAESIDLVLMDVQMPNMDGLEATRAIRMGEEGDTRHMPIVAMTAHALVNEKHHCFEVGMDAYISKPLQMAELAKQLDVAMCYNLD